MDLDWKIAPEWYFRLLRDNAVRMQLGYLKASSVASLREPILPLFNKVCKQSRREEQHVKEHGNLNF